MFDFVIKNARILDGGGGPEFEADIAIEKGRIAAVGRVEDPAARVIDASGLIASPGFIDIHSHTDAGLLIDPRAESKLTQGVTLELCGNCGFSMGPCLDESGRAELDDWRRRHGIEQDWRTLDDALRVLAGRPLGVNIATLVGHANLRAAVVGLADREASPGEIAEMRRLAAEAMRQGAFGLSSGLIYAPSCFANAVELAGIASAVAPYGGFYASHIRSEGDRLVEAVEEAIEIGARAGVPVQIAHHKACGPRNWGRVSTTLDMIRQARDSGADVSVDQYPYTAGATSLSALLPSWAHDGGDRALLERIASRRDELLAALRGIGDTEGRIEYAEGCSSVMISSVRSDANRACEGMNLQQIAAARGRSAEDVILDLISQEQAHVSMVQFSQCEEDVRTVMRSPFSMVGTDAAARATTGELSKGKPHPRSFGTFARVLGRYARDEGVIPLETAVRKMTSMPARKLGLADRGSLSPGAWADVTVFDPERVIDRATYEEPHQTCLGIEYVFVNGRLAVERGELTGELAGQVVRKGAGVACAGGC